MKSEGRIYYKIKAYILSWIVDSEGFEPSTSCILLVQSMRANPCAKSPDDHRALMWFTFTSAKPACPYLAIPHDHFQA